MSEAVLIAWAEAIKAVATMITTIVEGQQKEVREAAWARWERQMDFWDRVFGLEPKEGPPTKLPARTPDTVKER